MGRPPSTVTVECGTAAEPTIVSCPSTRLACEVTIAAFATPPAATFRTTAVSMTAPNMAATFAT
jgi:hypothetical protein